MTNATDYKVFPVGDRGGHRGYVGTARHVPEVTRHRAARRLRPVRFTGLFGLGVLVALGAIVADLEIHPAGTTAAANGIVNIEKPGLNALLGKSS
jgi:hypothetical protein